MGKETAEPLLGAAPAADDRGWTFWLRVLAVFVGSALSSSVLQSFPTFEGILLDRRPEYGAGLFSSSCPPAPPPSPPIPSDDLDACPAQLNAATMLYSISLGSSVMFSLVLGWCFDRFGPRSSGTAAALMCSLTFVLLTVSLVFPSLNWLVWVAVTLSDIVGAMTAYALYGFIWHSPKHLTLIVSLYTSSTGLSSFLAEFAVWLVRGPVGVSPPLVWLLFALFSLISAGIICKWAPTSAEFHANASLVTGIESHPKKDSIFKAVRAMCRVATRAEHKMVNGLFLAYSTFFYVAVGAWAASFVKLENALLRPEQAAQMGALFAIIGGLMGSIVQPIQAAFYDKIGLPIFFTIVISSFVSFMALLAVPNLQIQIVMLVVGTLSMWSWFTLLLCWATHFAPPAMVGTYSGIVLGVAGLVQMGLVGLMPVVASLLGAVSAVDKIVRPMWLYGLLALLFGIATCLAVWRDGIPPSGSLLEHEGGLIEPLGLQPPAQLVVNGLFVPSDAEATSAESSLDGSAPQPDGERP